MTTNEVDIRVLMSVIFISLIGVLVLIISCNKVKADGIWLPSFNNLAKRQFEVYAIGYSAFWIR